MKNKKNKKRNTRKIKNAIRKASRKQQYSRKSDPIIAMFADEPARWEDLDDEDGDDLPF